MISCDTISSVWSPDDEIDFMRQISQLTEEQYNDLPDDIKAMVKRMTTEKTKQLLPQPGPQLDAFRSKADVLLYGGAAGGGKTFLAVLLALQEHKRTLYIRKEAAQLQAVKDEVTEILGNKTGFNSQTGVWNIPNSEVPGQQLRFGGVNNPGDETKYQGAPRDLLVVDEVANITEPVVRFLMGWVRSPDPKQRTRTLLCSNPPTDATGQWLIHFFAPWLDKTHPNPAQPGELRWFATISGKDIEVPNDKPFIAYKDSNSHSGYRLEYDVALAKHPEDVVTPQSRSFIPARVTDNAYLRDTGYMATLQALPEPLRSQMLYGDFLSGQEDDVWQVIPTQWVKDAMDRFKGNHPDYKPPAPPMGCDEMTSMGVDPSRGGRDESVIAVVYDRKTYLLHSLEGHSVPDGPTLGTEVLRVRRDMCPVHIDAVGVGGSVLDYLTHQGTHTVPVTGQAESRLRDETGTFKYRNMRSEIYWEFRQMLDPQNNPTIELVPDATLLADLTAVRYKILEGNKLALELKEELKKRIGRSPDKGDAVVYASVGTLPRDMVYHRTGSSRNSGRSQVHSSINSIKSRHSNRTKRGQLGSRRGARHGR